MGLQWLVPAGAAAHNGSLMHIFQTLDPGGGSSGSGSGSGSRHENSRQRKHRKKPEPTITTDSVANYQGRNTVDDLIKFIESGGSKSTPAAEKSGRKAERAGRRDVKSRRAAEDRAACQDRHTARRTVTKPSATTATATAAETATARSSSLEARPAAGESPSDHSRVCGDPAQTRDASPAPSETISTQDGVTSASASGVGDEFVRDFYSVTDDTGAQEDSEFHVVTRRQKRRPAARSTSSVGQETPVAGTPSWRHTRPGVSSRGKHTARSVTNSEETSDADSDGAASAPAGRGPIPSDSGVASAASSSTNSAACSASSSSSISSPGFSAASSAAASWADVAKPKPADSGSQTDFIDGVGAIFGDRSPPRGARASSLRRGDSGVEGRIGGAHPDEFPAIPAPAARSAASAPAAESAVPMPRSPVVASPAAEKDSAVTIATSQMNGLSSAVTAVTAQKVSRAAAPAVTPAVASVVTPAAPPVTPVTPVSRSRRSPVVEIPATVLPGDAARSESRLKMPGIQFGYIDTDGAETRANPTSTAAPDQKPEPERPPAAPTGVDGFCRRFRPQPVDVSQFNWREVSVFLTKVYAEAVRMSGSGTPRELQCTQRL